MLSDHPYPYILAAWRLTRAFPELQNNWHKEIAIACQELKIHRLSDADLNRCCYWWLSKILGYPEI